MSPNTLTQLDYFERNLVIKGVLIPLCSGFIHGILLFENKQSDSIVQLLRGQKTIILYSISVMQILSNKILFLFVILERIQLQFQYGDIIIS